MLKEKSQSLNWWSNYWNIEKLLNFYYQELFFLLFSTKSLKHKTRWQFHEFFMRIRTEKPAFIEKKSLENFHFTLKARNRDFGSIYLWHAPFSKFCHLSASDKTHDAPILNYSRSMSWFKLQNPFLFKLEVPGQHKLNFQ